MALKFIKEQYRISDDEFFTKLNECLYDIHMEEKMRAAGGNWTHTLDYYSDDGLDGISALICMARGSDTPPQTNEVICTLAGSGILGIYRDAMLSRGYPQDDMESPVMEALVLLTQYVEARGFVMGDNSGYFFASLRRTAESLEEALYWAQNGQEHGAAFLAELAMMLSNTDGIQEKAKLMELYLEEAEQEYLSPDGFNSGTLKRACYEDDGIQGMPYGSILIDAVCDGDLITLLSYMQDGSNPDNLGGMENLGKFAHTVKTEEFYAMSPDDVREMLDAMAVFWN